MNYSLRNLEPVDPLGMTQLQLMQMVPIGGKLHLQRTLPASWHRPPGFRSSDAAWELGPKPPWRATIFSGPTSGSRSRSPASRA